MFASHFPANWAAQGGVECRSRCWRKEGRDAAGGKKEEVLLEGRRERYCWREEGRSASGGKKGEALLERRRKRSCSHVL